MVSAKNVELFKQVWQAAIAKYGRGSLDERAAYAKYNAVYIRYYNAAQEQSYQSESGIHNDRWSTHAPSRHRVDTSNHSRYPVRLVGGEFEAKDIEE